MCSTYTPHIKKQTPELFYILDTKHKGYYDEDVQSRDTNVLMLMLEHEATDQVSVSSATSNLELAQMQTSLIYENNRNLYSQDVPTKI